MNGQPAEQLVLEWDFLPSLSCVSKMIPLCADPPLIIKQFADSVDL